MKVKNISFFNIDKLYEIVINKEQDENYRLKQFGKNLPQLFNHISILYELEEITALDYIFLKMYATYVSDFIAEDTKNTFLENNFNELYGNALQPYMDYVSSKPEYKRFYSPLGTITGSCTVNFTGIQLISLIGLDPSEFFIKSTETSCVIENNDGVIVFDELLTSKLVNDETFKNNCIKNFYNNFYRFMMNKITFVDLPSDAFVKSNFIYSDKYKNPVRLVSIRNPYFNMNFESKGSENLEEILNKYKEKNKDTNYTINNTYIEFSITSYIGVFFELFKSIPYGKFINMDSFLITMKNSLENELIIPNEVKNVTNSDEEYFINMKKYIEFLNNKISDVYNDNSNTLKKAQLIRCDSEFNYNILLSLSDVNVLSNINILNNDILSKETISVRDTIIKLSKTVYQLLK